MKKYFLGIIFILFVALPFSFTGCNDDVNPGGTAVENVAGDWVVRCYVKDADGVWDDILGYAYEVDTYNTSANLPTEMWLSDSTYFGHQFIKVAVDNAKRSFYTSVPANIESRGTTYMEYMGPGPDYNGVAVGDTANVTVYNGIVLPGAAKSYLGHKTDSICYFMKIKGNVFKVSGYKRTGFIGDDQ